MSKHREKAGAEFRADDLSSDSFFSRVFNPDSTGDAGLWCGDCRRRQAWTKLITRYELRTGDVFRVWFCPACGKMVREDNLTDLGLAQEVEARDVIVVDYVSKEREQQIAKNRSKKKKQLDKKQSKKKYKKKH